MTTDKEFKAIVIRLLSMILYLVFWTTYEEIEMFNSKATENYQNLQADAKNVAAGLGRGQ